MASTMNCRLGTLHSAYSRRHNGEHIHSPISKLLVSELHGRSRLLRVSCKSRSVDVLELNKTENQSYDGVIYQKGRESDDAVLNQWTCERKPTSDNVKADKKPTFNPFKYDAFDIGFITTDDFTNADILEATYPAVAKRLHSDWVNDSAIPVVTGSLGKGLRSGAITTLGWGASALTATTIAKALGLREIKVLPPQSMGPAREGDIPLRVKNPYNPKAPGTLITRAQDMIKAVLSGTVFKNTVILLYILSRAIIDQIDKHPSNLWSRKDPSWEWKGKTFEQVFPDTDQGSLVTIALALRSLIARALGSLVTGARDMFKEVQSTEALMKLAVMLYVVSSLVLRQLRKDKSDVTVLAMRLYSTSWCIKYACLLFLIGSLSVNHSLLNSWIPLPLVISCLV